MLTTIATTLKTDKGANIVLGVLSLGTSFYDKLIDFTNYLPTTQEITKEVIAALFIFITLKLFNFGYPKIVTYIVTTKTSFRARKILSIRKKK